MGGGVFVFENLSFRTRMSYSEALMLCLSFMSCIAIELIDFVWILLCFLRGSVEGTLGFAEQSCEGNFNHETGAARG